MRHNKHIMRPSVLLAILFANEFLMEPLSDIVNQGVQPFRNLLGGLSARTPVPPDIPWFQTGVLALRGNGRGCHALVVAVVPLADCFGDFDVTICPRVRRGDLVGSRGLEWERVLVAQVEQFESPLGTRTRGDVASIFDQFCCECTVLTL